jgi:hypothetical protein
VRLVASVVADVEAGSDNRAMSVPGSVVVGLLARAGVLALVLHAGCETCGPPAEPLIDLVVTIAVPTDSSQYVHASMLDARGDVVTSTSRPMVSVDGGTWHSSLGNCDGTPQESGTFTIIAWLDTNPDVLEPRPPQDARQATDLVEVHCSAGDGCFPARAARITIE